MESKALIGGALLGSGRSGCTFSPAPKCADGKRFKEGSVAKLVREDFRAELALGQAIMSLPTASAYFAAPVNSCKPVEPINDPDESKCSHLTDTQEIAEGPLTLLEMPNAGMSLEMYTRNLPALIANYRRIFVHLLEGAIVLHSAGLVHNDIHSNNIMVDRLGVARIIDFGRAFKVNRVREWEDAALSTRFDPKFVLHAPEIHAWTLLRSGTPVREGLDRLLSLDSNIGVGQDYISLQRRFPLRTPFETVMLEFIRTDPMLEERYRAIRAGNKEKAHSIGGDYIRKWAYGFDSWRLGLTMFFIWEEKMMVWLRFKETSLYIEERARIYSALNGLTEFDPNKRLSVKKALAILDPGNRMAD